MFIRTTTKPQSHLRPETSGISENDWNVLADYWHPVAIADNLQNQPLKAKLLDIEIVLYRGVGNAIGAAVDACPHRHIRLSSGKVIDGQIVCAFHGLRFDTNGRCQLIPGLSANTKIPSKYQVRSFPVKERYGLLWVCLGDPSQHDVPVLPDISDTPVTHLGIGAPLVWPVSAARQIENFFDLSHLPTVHRTMLGGDPANAMRPGQVEQTNDAVILKADYLETPSGGEPRPCKFTYRIVIPFAIDFTVRDDSESVMHAYNIASPTSAHQSVVFQILSSKPESEAVRKKYIEVFTVLNQEDINVLSNLTLQDLPLDQHHEIHLPVDNICNAYRTRLRDLGLGR